MSPLTLVLVALGVSADAFAVSLGRGLKQATLTWRSVLLLAATFGVFQAVMPLIGYALGTGLADYVTAVDHWIAFGLLVAIGLRMIWEAVHPDADGDSGDDGRIPLRELLVLAVATSIDALAVGISLAFLDVDIVTAVLVIGVTTFVLSLAGVLIGHRAGSRFRGPAEIVGGLVLVGIGTKVLVDHLTGS